MINRLAPSPTRSENVFFANNQQASKVREREREREREQNTEDSEILVF